MHKLLSLALAAVALAASSSKAHATPVTWTFYATSCIDGGCSQFGQLPAPIAIADLTLYTLAASANVSIGCPGGLPLPCPEITQVANITGEFSLDLFLATGFPPLPDVVTFSSAAPYLSFPPGGLFGTLNWPLSGPPAIDLTVWFRNGAQTDYFITDTSANLASDQQVGPCRIDSSCLSRGSWVEQVPEPASAALLLTGLLAAWMAREAERRRTSPGLAVVAMKVVHESRAS